jgi:hypothetical protein
MSLWDVLSLSPVTWVGLSVLLAGLLLTLQLKGRLRPGALFVLAAAILATLSTVFGQIILYSEHATLNGILYLGIPSVTVAAVLGAIQSKLAKLAADTARGRESRDGAILGILLLAILLGLLIYATLLLFGLWATG